MSFRVDAAAVRTLEAGFRGGTSVAVAAPAPPGDRGPDAGHPIDTADRVVLRTHDDAVVLVVTADGLGRPPRGGDGGAAAAAVPALAGPGNGGHDAADIALPHAV